MSQPGVLNDAALPTDVDINEEKRDIEQYEQKPTAVDDHVVMKSPFDDLPFMETLKLFKKAGLMASLAAFMCAADGYQISMTGSIIANKGFIQVYGTARNAKGAKILAADVLATWGGIQSMGQGLGMLTMHFLADRYGRKIAFYTLWLVLVAGVLCETFGRHWHIWTLAKLFSGYAVGSVQFLSSTYIAEIVPSRTRGFLLIFHSLWYAIGQLFASLALKILADHNPYNYLDLIYTEWAMVGIIIMIFLYVPESPWWCANHDKDERGKAILKRLNGAIPGYDVDFHWQLMKQTVHLEKQYALELHGPPGGFWKSVKDSRELFTGVNGFRTLIAFFPTCVQQISGLAVLSNYSSYFAQIAGFADPFLFALLIALVGIAITLVCQLVTDFIGRRTLFLTGVVATWSCLMIIGGMGLIKNPSSATNKLVLFFSLVWRMSSIILGTLGWSFGAETGSSRLRAKTAGVAAAGGVAVGLLFSTTVPYMLAPTGVNWGLKTCFFFAGVSFPFCVATFFLIPDISKRSHAELDEMFEKKIRPWRFRSYVTDAQRALEAEKERQGTADAAALQRRE